MMSERAAKSVNVWQANVLCGLGFLTMLTVGYIVAKMGKPSRVKSNVPFWLWRNILISFLHAVVVGVWNILW